MFHDFESRHATMRSAHSVCFCVLHVLLGTCMEVMAVKTVDTFGCLDDKNKMTPKWLMRRQKSSIGVHGTYSYCVSCGVTF